MQLSWKHQTILYIFLFLVGVSAHLYKVTSIAPAISHDEVYYYVEAKSIGLSGKDPSGEVSPWQLKAANPLFAELPGTIMAPAAMLFPNQPVLAGRFTHVIIGALFAIVLAGVVEKLFHNKALSIITAIACLCNPWFFENSRMSFDSLLSLFFYFSAIWAFLSSQKKFLPISFVLFAIGFYQYQGLKLIFPPLILVLTIYKLQLFELSPKKWVEQIKKEYWVCLFAVLTMLFFGVHVLRLKSSVAGGRVNDLIFFNKEFIENKLAVQRAQSLVSPINKIFVNKPMIIVTVFLEKYLNAFDLNQLFLHVDSFRNPFAVWSKGVFHLIDLPLILLGSWVALRNKKWRQQALLIGMMILIAPLPLAVNSKDTWMFFRASFLFPWGIILASVGMWYIWQKKIWVLTGATTFVYVLFLSGFLFEYFSQYPIYGTTDRYFSERVMSRYVKEAALQGKQVQVFAEEPYYTYTMFIALANQTNKQNLPQIQQSYQAEQYKLNAVTVDSKCFSPSSLNGAIAVVDARIPVCDGESIQDISQGAIMIPSLIDSGAQFKIFNDSICTQYGLPNFSHVTTNVFDVENLKQDEFCRSFLAIYR
jgi:hypothetical protein